MIGRGVLGRKLGGGAGNYFSSVECGRGQGGGWAGSGAPAAQLSQDTALPNVAEPGGNSGYGGGKVRCSQQDLMRVAQQVKLCADLAQLCDGTMMQQSRS